MVKLKGFVKDLHIKFFAIDLFCGAGGVSEGMKRSGVCKVIACINHDPKALKAHALNHPDSIHFEEDITKFKIERLLPIIADAREKYPNAKLLLWASVECTNHSIAKGGMPKDADSRTLPVHLFKYINILKPDYVGIENVVEFRHWSELVPKINAQGMTAKNQKSIYRAFKSDLTPYIEGAHCPLVINQRESTITPWLIPDPNRKGEYFEYFIKKIKELNGGYDYEDRDLNAQNFNAFTSRKRYYGIFALKGLGIKFPKPTHGEGLLPLKAVKEVLELENIGKSVFTRKKPLADKTLIRLHQGLIKFSDEQLIMTCTTPGHLNPVSEPCGTLTTACHKAFINVKRGQFLDKYFGKAKCQSIEKTIGTLTLKDRYGFVSANFLESAFGNPEKNPRVKSVHKPAPSVTTQGRTRVVFTLRHYGSIERDKGVSSINAPNGALTATGSQGIAHAQYIHSHYSKGTEGAAITGPCPTVTTIPKQALVTSYLLNPQFGNKGNSINKPCPTIIAQQGKKPLSRVTAFHYELPIPWYLHDTDTDSAAMRALKAYCRENGISDVFHRMLTINELKQIQGFSIDYKLYGNQEDMKKQLGNCVEVNQCIALILALAEGINTGKIEKKQALNNQFKLEFAA